MTSSILSRILFPTCSSAGCGEQVRNQNPSCDDGKCVICRRRLDEPKQEQGQRQDFSNMTHLRNISPEILLVDVISRALSTYAHIEGMKAENQLRLSMQETPAYDEQSFIDVLNKSGITTTEVLHAIALMQQREGMQRGYSK